MVTYLAGCKTLLKMYCTELKLFPSQERHFYCYITKATIAYRYAILARTADVICGKGFTDVSNQHNGQSIPLIRLLLKMFVSLFVTPRLYTHIHR